MSQQQEDGEYPRLNSKMIQTDHSHIGSIISVIGSVVSNDGSVVTLRCADGGNARIAVDPSFDTQAGSVVEIVGLLESDRSVQVRAFFLCEVVCGISSCVLRILWYIYLPLSPSHSLSNFFTLFSHSIL
uniref:Replication factor A protein 3 n=1 Tax=Ditylum brightwellii TaxID=49249 RepID=A0A7S4RLK9_9STRA|mmetsp:Transcript_28158/g.42114  ORF Transcript_28158/g.42114 Transcript_28158/m.42114 type:complete len:129 (-) Transcript_28158:565-951(-)